MMRIVVILAAFFSLFAFPFPATLVLGFAAAFFLPPLALCIGMLADLLYASPYSWPFYTLLGAVGAIVAVLVRRFVKTRII